MNDARPAAGMYLYYLDDAAVLFCERTQELHLLNRTAAVIWSLLEEGLDAAAIGAALHADYGADAASSHAFVEAAFAEWTHKGFLNDGSETLAGAPAATPPRLDVPWRPFDVAAERHYRLLSCNFRVRFSALAQEALVHPVLAHLESDDVAGATEIDVIEEPGRVLVHHGRRCYAACPGDDGIAPLVKSAVWMTVVRDHRYFLDIHAGVVSDGMRCVLLPAAAGSGKSTLTAALVHAGYEFFSDEVALLDERTFDVFPVPLAMCVKDTGIEALADRFPALRTLPQHLRGDGKRVTYMAPPPNRMPRTDAPRSVCALVFPRYTPGNEAALVELPKAEALQRLMGECLAVSDGLDAARVEALVAWISRLPCYSLVYPSTADALAAVGVVFARATEPSTGAVRGSPAVPARA